MDTFHELAEERDGRADEGQRGGGGSGLDAEADDAADPSLGSPRGIGGITAFFQQKK
jgi:hypothetical protein